jgi:hypothetical protein
MLHETLMIWRTVYVNVTWDYDDLKNCLGKCYMRLWWFEELFRMICWIVYVNVTWDFVCWFE